MTERTRLDLDELDRYVSGDLTDAERNEIESILAAHPAEAALVEKLRRSVRLPNSEASARDLSAFLERLEAARVGSSSRQAVQEKSRAPTRFSPLNRASALALTVGAAAMVALVGFAISSKSSAEWRHTYSVRAGQRGWVTFPDGSRATLAPSTTLIATRESRSAAISVTVNGQAEFAVVPKSARAFSVKAGANIVNVLGTRFVVRRYSDEHVTRVFVVDGRVAFRRIRPDERDRTNLERPLVLSARTLAVASDSGPVQVSRDVNTEDYTAWASGRLVFHQTPVARIVAELNRAYATEIRIDDLRLRNRSLTWTIPVEHQSLTEVLDALSVVLDAHYVRTGQVITILPGWRQSRRLAAPSRPSTEAQYGR